MKRIIILSMMFVAVAISSCKKYLDVQPQQTFGSNLAVTSVQGLQETTLGAYSQIQGGNLYGGGIIANSELMADFVFPANTTVVLSNLNTSQEYTHQFNIYNANAGGMWASGYQAILTANTVLQYLPNFQASDPSDCNLMKGNCLFIRAAMHFELVKMFAQPWGFTSNNTHLGIPIRLTPGTSTTGQNTPRSTVAQVYAQIISDLQAAIPLLPQVSNAELASQYAAEAMLARVYFAQNDFTDAAKYAGMVINGGFSLSSSLRAAFQQLGTTTSTETVFQIINTAKNDPSNGNLHSNFSAALYGYLVPNLGMNTPFVAILQSALAVGDQRASLFQKITGDYFCMKDSLQYTNVPVIRLEEMYLTRAESEAQTSDLSDASTDYNTIRTHAGLAPDLTMTQQGLINGIRGQRDLELAIEGDHYYEVKRRAALSGSGFFNTPGAGQLAWNAFNMIYPIPQQEVQENSAMVQNPGY